LPNGSTTSPGGPDLAEVAAWYCARHRWRVVIAAAMAAA